MNLNFNSGIVAKILIWSSKSGHPVKPLSPLPQRLMLVHFFSEDFVPRTFFAFFIPSVSVSLANIKNILHCLHMTVSPPDKQRPKPGGLLGQNKVADSGFPNTLCRPSEDSELSNPILIW
jgi:hypothetical protein